MQGILKRRAFTVGNLVVAIVPLLIIFVLANWIARGCSSQLSDNIIVNPLHFSTAKIQVLTTYFASNELGNVYRVYASVVWDSDAFGRDGEEPPRETFEIEDSFIDGNYRTADLFGELRTAEQTGKIFEIELRGERSGISGTGSFRQIHSVTVVEAE